MFSSSLAVPEQHPFLPRYCSTEVKGFLYGNVCPTVSGQIYLKVNSKLLDSFY